MSQNVETIRRIHLPEKKVFLELRDYPNAPEDLELRVSNEDCQEWFGNLKLVLQPEFAIDLGQALISAGHEKLSKLKAGSY